MFNKFVLKFHTPHPMYFNPLPFREALRRWHLANMLIEIGYIKFP